MRGALLGPATFFCAAGGATAAVWPKIYGDIIRRRSEGEEEEGRPRPIKAGYFCTSGEFILQSSPEHVTCMQIYFEVHKCPVGGCVNLSHCLSEEVR